MAEAPRDNNRIPAILGVSSADGTTPVPVYADPTTHRLLVNSASGMTNPMTTGGDLIYGGTGGTPTRLANGTAGQVLTSQGTTLAPIWSNAGASPPYADNAALVKNSVDTTKLVIFSAASITTGTTRTFTLPDVTDTILTLTSTGTVTSKTFNNTNSYTAKDGSFTLQNSADTTKQVQFALASLTTGNTRTITVPDASGTMTLLGNASTGSGSVVLATSPTLTTPTLGVATATTINKVTLTAPATGSTLTIVDGKTLTVNNTMTLAAGADSQTFTFPATGGTVTVLGNTTTGSGSIVLATSPTLTTPTLGVASATTVNKVTLTAPATGSTLTIADGKTLTANNSITLAGTDATTMTFPSTSATIARTDAGQTFTGTQVFTSPKIITSVVDTNGNTLVGIGATASAVNYVKFTNAATGTAGPILSADGETNVDLKLAGKGTGAVHVTTGSYGDITADSDGATITFNLATSNVHSVTLGGNRTLALSNEHVGQCFILRLAQDATGSRTVTWFTTIKWAGGAAPTLTTTASKADVFGFVVTSAGNYDGFVIGQNL